MDGPVVPCKALRGYLKKKHTSQKAFAPKYGTRFCWVDDVKGTLCYSKTQSELAAVRSSVLLRDIRSVELSGEGTAYEHLPAHSIVIYHAEDPAQHVFVAEDREEAWMWGSQLSARAAAAGGMLGEDQKRSTGDRLADGSAPSDPAPPELLSDDEEEEEQQEAGGEAMVEDQVAAPPPKKVPRATAESHDSAAATGAPVASVAPPAASVPSLALDLACVKADFVAEHDCELGCTAGELLLPTPWLPAPPGWSFAARPASGHHGLVPTEYLDMMPALATALAPALATALAPALAPSEAPALSAGSRAAAPASERDPSERDPSAAQAEAPASEAPASEAPQGRSPLGAAARAQARRAARAQQARPEPISAPQASASATDDDAIIIDDDDGAGVLVAAPPASSCAAPAAMPPPPSPGVKRKAQRPPSPPEPSPPPSAPSDSPPATAEATCDVSDISDSAVSAERSKPSQERAQRWAAADDDEQQQEEAASVDGAARA